MKKIRFIFYLLICSFSANSQNCGAQGDLPFKVGEILSYKLSYNWGIIWADAGFVNFTVKDTIVQGKQIYHFGGYGSSYRKWDWFYKVRSNYESWTKTDLTPILFARKGREGSNRYDRKYWVDGEQVKYQNNDDPEKYWEKKINLGACPYDVISAIYYTRSIDFNSASPGDKIPLNLYLDGAKFDSYLKYVGKENWKHPDTDRVYECIVFKPYLIEGTVFSAGENMTVYVTDDDKKIPVYIETELVVGKGKVYLTSATGTK